MQVIALALAVILGLNQLGLLDGPPITLRTVRVGGTDPISAAASVARESHGRGSATVIIAGTEALADGVVATGLAGALGAPILLNGPERLDPQTRDVLRELGAETVVLIGGTTALSEAVEVAIRDDLGAEVQRLAGTSRFDTAGLVADAFAEAAELGLLDGRPSALVVPSTDVPAGLEAGSLAATGGNPLPVLISQAGQLPEPTRAAIDRLGVEHLLVVGDLTGWDGPMTQITGAAGAAEAAVELREFRPPRVVVVPAQDEARALIAGPLAGREAGVILTEGEARDWLRSACGTVRELFVVAEPDVIDDLEVTALENAVTNCG